MATASATAIPAANSSTSGFGNQFSLHDEQNKTHIVYKLQKGGPILVGSTVGGPVLEYTGAEGSFTFEGPQVTQETTTLGTLLTVTLNVVPDLRILTFSMLMPQVTAPASAGVGSSQSFETTGFKAQHHTTLIGTLPPGGNPTYVTMKLQGTATSVEVAD